MTSVQAKRIVFVFSIVSFVALATLALLFFFQNCAPGLKVLPVANLESGPEVASCAKDFIKSANGECVKKVCQPGDPDVDCYIEHGQGKSSCGANNLYGPCVADPGRCEQGYTYDSSAKSCKPTNPIVPASSSTTTPSSTPTSTLTPTPMTTPSTGSPISQVSSTMNDTGQAQCSNADGTSFVSCDDSSVPQGQDGHYGRDVQASLVKKGRGVAGFDFTKICMDGREKCEGSKNTGPSPASGDWACTRDNLTNRIWSLEEKYGQYGGGAVSGFYNFSSMERCGKKGNWRTPKRRELLSLLHHGGLLLAGNDAKPGVAAIDNEFFPNVQGSSYWVDEACVMDGCDSFNKLFVNMASGQSGHFPSMSPDENFNNVATNLSNLFVHDGDGNVPSISNNFKTLPENQEVILDESFQLIWEKCTYGLRGNECKEGQGQKYNWHDALAMVQKANSETYKGFKDWRLPNIKELESLAQLDMKDSPGRYGQRYDIFPPGINSGTMYGDQLWSATNGFSPTRAFYMEFYQACKIDQKPKTEKLPIRLVRDATVP